MSLSITESRKPAITADEFKAAFRNHPGGVAVITADAGNGPVGLTATSVDIGQCRNLPNPEFSAPNFRPAPRPFSAQIPSSCIY